MRFANAKITANTAPLWITTLKSSVGLTSSFRPRSANKRCPVDDTGRNSVTPSMIPKRMTVQFVTARLEGKSALLTSFKSERLDFRWRGLKACASLDQPESNGSHREGSSKQASFWSFELFRL